MEYHLIEQLKQIVFDGGFDEESRKQVIDLEEHLHRLVVAENLKQHPPALRWPDCLTYRTPKYSEVFTSPEKVRSHCKVL